MIGKIKLYSRFLGRTYRATESTMMQEKGDIFLIKSIDIRYVCGTLMTRYRMLKNGSDEVYHIVDDFLYSIGTILEEVTNGAEVSENASAI